MKYKDPVKKYFWPGIYLLLSVGAVFIVLPEIAIFKGSDTQFVSSIFSLYTLLSLAALTVASIAAAGIYTALLPGKLSLAQATVAQLAASFVNRIVPIGVGALGISYLHLRSRRISASLAAATVTANNIVGLAGNIVLIAGCLLFEPSLVGRTATLRLSPALGIAVVVIMVMIALLIFVRKRAIRSLLSRFITDLKTSTLTFSRSGKALVWSLLLSLLHSAHVWLACQAVGLDISFTVAVLTMSVRSIAASATPSPGGIGGVELATASLLALYGYDASQALSAALLARLIIYVSSFGFGLPAFMVARRKAYI